MTALDTIIARVMVIVRGIALAEIVVQVIIWHSFYLASPWLLWGPAVIFATDDALDRPTLSAQETRTLRLYATGLPIKSVARRLGIGERQRGSMYAEFVKSTHRQTVRRPPR